ncbi:chemotaxis protein CheX [Faucicola atlantae]|uniref:Chemotaxis protein CheC n=1 Tax=Faucicola atlantae TaxID=34059 RepID=A0A1B8Q9D0_9GAMM|nr:chemotaxis protein CheX [Moraxella atlantae]OBX75350.1 chemotaxis protein CheC [Moraxella atlantae]
MKAEKLHVFVESVAHFFKQIRSDNVEVDTPYLNDNTTPLAYDYSGIINITGPLEGCVYVSSETPMLRNILLHMGEPATTEELLKDLVGEIANTVSGNARREFGSDFIISTPIVINGAPSETYLPRNKRSYIIPVKWDRYKTLIGICLS